MKIANCFARVYFLLLLTMGFSATSALAQNPPDDDDPDEVTIGGNLEPVEEWYKKQTVQERLAGLDFGLMGDKIDPNTGALVLEQTDISIPGNFNLPVAITRRLSNGALYHENTHVEFADWELLVPKIAVTVMDNSSLWQLPAGPRCSEPFYSSLPVAFTANGADTEAKDYSSGVVLDVPGHGSQQILENPSAVFPVTASHVTTNHWYLECLDLAGGGEGFYAYSPKGDRYRFDKLISRQVKDLPYYGHSISAPERVKVILLATEARDVHDNTVTYEYHADGRLKKISSSDNRVIDVRYHTGAGETELISEVEANGRVWKYEYRQTDFVLPLWEQSSVDEFRDTNYKILQTVEQPSSTLTVPKKWIFDTDGMFAEPPPGNCFDVGGMLNITHPNGTLGQFTIATRKHRQSFGDGIYTANECPISYPHIHPAGFGHPEPYQISYAKIISVHKKTISGSNIPTSEWNYEYEQDIGEDTSGSDRTNWTKVTQPDGTEETYYHFWHYESLGGKLDRKVTKNSSGAVVKTENFTYQLSGDLGQTYLDSFPGSLQAQAVTTSMSTALNQELDTFYKTATYNQNFQSAHYSYGKPLTITSWSNVSTSPRTQVNTFEHNKTKWILGLLDTSTINTTPYLDYDYNTKGQKTSYKKHGATFATFEYFPASSTTETPGTLKSFTDGVLRKTELSDWYRGVPQTISRPNSSYEEQNVDANGWLTSTRDGRGNVTIYTHNSLSGLLETINPPGSNYDSTTFSYQHHPTGGVTQTITKGGTTTTVEYDTLLRPIFETNTATNPSWTSYLTTEYDVMGRVSFEPIATDDSARKDGYELYYDALGRIEKRVEIVPGVPAYETLYDYQTGNNVVVTDPAGFDTTTTRDGYAGPDKGDIIQIVQEVNPTSNVTTTIDRNQFGNITAVEQGDGSLSKTQSFVYNDEQLICRMYTPEAGYTLYAYNAANEMTAYAKGQGGVACTDNIAATNDRVTMTYNALGLVETINYNDSNTPDITKLYDADGNLTSAARADAGDQEDAWYTGSTATTWTYQYDEIGNLDWEKAVLDDVEFFFNHDYSSNGALSRTVRKFTSPSWAPGETFEHAFDYTSDSMGRGTGISYGVGTGAANIPIVSGGDFHYSGNLLNLNFANGQSLTQYTNMRHQIRRLATAEAGVATAQNQVYDYDGRGLIIAQTDHQQNNDRTYTYDGLGRLKTASGPWETITGGANTEVSGTFSYDGLGNLTSRQLGSLSINYTYHPTNNRLLNVTSSGPTGSRNLSYDSHGNVTALGGLSFVYDAADRPIETSGDAVMAYRYDAHNRRIKSIEDYPTGGITRYHLYSLTGTITYEVKDHPNATLDKINQYVSLDGKTVAEIETFGTPSNPAEELSYIHTDILGTPRASTGYTGTMKWRRRHSPYGIAIEDNPAYRDKAGYTGHVEDSATGLVYMQARYYDAVMGRFLSVDPVDFRSSGLNPGMLNRYSYASNNPTSKIDPDGRESWLISRPLDQKWTGKNHMFVANRNDETGKITRYSYGPQNTKIISNPGKLVNLTGTQRGTDLGDANALNQFLADPAAAAEKGIVAESINASDAAVIASGEAINAVLGHGNNPAETAPNYSIFPATHDLTNPSGGAGNPITANSNSAAYAVANRANPYETQAIPAEGRNPGLDQHGNIPCENGLRC